MHAVKEYMWIGVRERHIGTLCRFSDNAQNWFYGLLVDIRFNRFVCRLSDGTELEFMMCHSQSEI